MRFRNRSGELFFLLLACLAQVVTVLACTLWRARALERAAPHPGVPGVVPGRIRPPHRL